MRASEPSETVARASSGPRPAPGAKADMPVPGMEIGAPPVAFSLEQPPALRRLLRELTLLGWWRATVAKLPQLPGQQPKVLWGGEDPRSFDWVWCQQPKFRQPAPKGMGGYCF
jgi:hypothetical protein